MNDMKSLLIATVVILSGLSAAQTASGNPPAPTAPVSQPTGATAKLDPTKEADIRKLLMLTGTDKLVNQMLDSMEESIRPLMTSSLPAGEYRGKLVELFFEKFHSKAAGQQIIEMAIPAYAQYYTDDEVKQLIAFYETPLGQKTVEVTPQLMAAMQKGGQEWGENLGQECMIEVLTEHPELKKAMQEAAHPAKIQ